MTNGEFKRTLLETGLFHKTGNGLWFRCDTCPFCGDIKKHMYVLIKLADDTPVLYHCFKCNSHGVMNQSFLNYFGIDNLKIPKWNCRKVHCNSRDEISSFEILDEINHANMINIGMDYIQKRVGIRPDIDQLKSFCMIGNPYGYVQDFIGGNGYGLKNRLWFQLVNGCMVGRLYDSDEGDRWKKYTGNTQTTIPGIYMIKNGIDTYQTINVCICEGVMDAIGLYYNGNIANGLFIACLGRDYGLGMKYALDMGIFGESVQIRFYLDSDVDDVKLPPGYDRLFKSISYYKNTSAKDYGIPIDLLSIEKIQNSYESQRRQTK